MDSPVYNFYRGEGETPPDFAQVQRMAWGKDRGYLVTYMVTRFAKVEGGYRVDSERAYLTLTEAFEVLESEGFINGGKPSHRSVNAILGDWSRGSANPFRS